MLIKNEELRSKSSDDKTLVELSDNLEILEILLEKGLSKYLIGNVAHHAIKVVPTL